MGKASRFFKSLLGFKTTTDSPPDQPKKPLNRRWSFGKPRTAAHAHNRRTKSIDGTSLRSNHRNSYTNEDPIEQPIALAAATAAVVEAAVAAAHAAAEVVRMTGGSVGYGGRHEMAAVKIQSCFRAYLARRALRALKALVKLQAVVRGHIVRKQTTDMMRRLQALIRAQTRARAVRSQVNGSTTKQPSHFQQHRNASKSYVRGITGQERMSLDSSTNHEIDKIVEVDTGTSHVMTKGRKLYQPDQINFWNSHSLTKSRGSTLQQPTSSSPCASCEVNSFYDSRSCISSYSDHPNYMANTESSRAKVRSVSAPRLRPQLEASNSTKRDLGYKYVMGMQRGPTTRDSYTKKIYHGSGRLDPVEMSVYDKESEFCVGYWN
ncbi:protein IQ-DOMAIN 23-like isoform X2 [Bidens hawaiensis]|uniref:protein IQ-DOMAIN 23-like isoform X2 n=1 Tax=Bidens hawaiensis TaxID=980011 RepID=UPI004049610F